MKKYIIKKEIGDLSQSQLSELYEKGWRLITATEIFAAVEGNSKIYTTYYFEKEISDN